MSAATEARHKPRPKPSCATVKAMDAPRSARIRAKSRYLLLNWPQPGHDAVQHHPVHGPAPHLERVLGAGDLHQKIPWAAPGSSQTSEEGPRHNHRGETVQLAVHGQAGRERGGDLGERLGLVPEVAVAAQHYKLKEPADGRGAERPGQKLLHIVRRVQGRVQQHRAPQSRCKFGLRGQQRRQVPAGAGASEHDPGRFAVLLCGRPPQDEAEGRAAVFDVLRPAPLATVHRADLPPAHAQPVQKQTARVHARVAPSPSAAMHEEKNGSCCIAPSWLERPHVHSRSARHVHLLNLECLVREEKGMEPRCQRQHWPLPLRRSHGLGAQHGCKAPFGR
mmetsp:Transcript_101802/g.292123  ORF Transcript_101802/g.292123 Transcript_101802/m.292123 type:complete len:335 (+) Transcript_101802:73-1077(+)